MPLEIILGSLKEAYQQTQPGTMQHVDELQAARTTDISLRNQAFYTADYNQYALRGKKQIPVLGIARERHNLILGNIDEALRQLIQEKNYHPSAEEAERVFRARGKNGTELFDLTKLNLQRYHDEFNYFEIGTSPEEYSLLNPEQRRLAERVEGKGKAFPIVMKMLKDDGIKSTRIYVLDPNYVREYAARGPIARVSWLFDFCDGSDFLALGRDVNNLNARRAVCGVIAAGDAPKNGLVP
ncbi:MAG TPA: hypothetical protein VJI98_00645 [Candidatus Nanoarchaeia archaeon]|nr:hypothetical protein [Candidatus Nanoarchaeia archaeon]